MNGSRNENSSREYKTQADIGWGQYERLGASADAYRYPTKQDGRGPVKENNQSVSLRDFSLALDKAIEDLDIIYTGVDQDLEFEIETLSDYMDGLDYSP